MRILTTPSWVEFSVRCDYARSRGGKPVAVATATGVTGVFQSCADLTGRASALRKTIVGSAVDPGKAGRPMVMERALADVLNPVVTVAIPTYVGARQLGTAIESVLRQTFTDFELVVIDDHSPDETAAVVARFTDPRLVYLRNSRNLGPEGNWNRCLEVARGRYFKLMPHDDVLHPNCLERQVAVLDADTDQRIAVVFSARDVLGPDGRNLAKRSYPGGFEGVISRSKVMRDCVRLGTNLVGEPGAVMFRKSLADRVGSFDATNPYVIDLDYWFRLLALGDAYYCAERLAGFRVSRASWSVAIGSKQGRDFRRFAERAVSPATFWDHCIGRLTARMNNLARLVFYYIYLR